MIVDNIQKMDIFSNLLAWSLCIISKQLPIKEEMGPGL